MSKLCFPVPLSLMATHGVAEYIRRKVGGYFIEKGVAQELAPPNDPMGGDFDVTLFPVEGKDRVLNPADLARVEVDVDGWAAWPFQLFVTSRQLLGWQPPKDDVDFPEADQPMMSMFLELVITAELGDLKDICKVSPASPE